MASEIAVHENVETVLPSSTAASGPIPLSFPAILRNPGIATRFAHLHGSQSVPHSSSTVPKKHKRGDNEGKRWVRRKENARFVGNPHVVQATRGDYATNVPHPKPTFPEPLPAYLARVAKLPATAPPALDPRSANAGRFSLSLKGMRRDLRRAGLRAQCLVRDVEEEVLTWLQGGTVILPDAHGDTLDFPGRPIGETQTILEVSRTPLQMVWSISDDAFARYVVHCCARYYEVVSFSKETSGQRLTYLLRPNIAGPDAYSTMSMYTPPVTDTDYSSHLDTDPESDILSDILAEATESDAEPPHSPGALVAISESPSPSPTPLDAEGDDWSMIDDGDADDDPGYDGDLAADLDQLSIQAGPRQPRIPLQDPPLLQSPLRTRALGYRSARSSSSPSRSPVRRPARRRAQMLLNPPRQPASHSTFFEYLFR
ncbi:hypothetical protein HGRIS_002456 [Hohenbuehelia grisea]|uniref:Uncharacterized protein n=1 Tax=Hohenbuehelia grisea TaxID=104357 RepID=A0ABR3JKH6_9AGAR